jgi:hypothetical protein
MSRSRQVLSLSGRASRFGVATLQPSVPFNLVLDALRASFIDGDLHIRRRRRRSRLRSEASRFEIERCQSARSTLEHPSVSGCCVRRIIRQRTT